jgi:Tfp pilus assembly protein PilE
MLTTALLLLLLAQSSQPPTPSPTVGSQAPQQEAETQTRPADVQPQPTIPPALEPPSINLPAQEESEQSDPQCCESHFEFWTDGSSWVIAIVTSILAFLAYRQWREMATTARAAKDSAQALMNAERAYVGIQYRQKKDTDWTEEFSFHKCSDRKTLTRYGETCRRLHVRIVNSGKTPATVRKGGVKLTMDQAGIATFDPISAVFADEQQISPNFIQAGGHFSEKLTYRLTDAEVAAAGNRQLWLIGFVEYMDTFERSHRAGFCRRVMGDGSPQKNNLSVDETCKDGNYDYQIDKDRKRIEPTPQKRR